MQMTVCTAQCARSLQQSIFISLPPPSLPYWDEAIEASIHVSVLYEEPQSFFYNLSIRYMLLIVLEKYKTYTQHPISYLHIFVKSIEILPRWCVESRSIKGKGKGVGGGHLLKEDGGHWSFWAQLRLPSWPCRLRSAGSGKVDTGHPGWGSKSYMLGRLVNSLMTAASFQTETPNVHYLHSISTCGALWINFMVCFISPLYLLEINSQRINKTCYCFRK